MQMSVYLCWAMSVLICEGSRSVVPMRPLTSRTATRMVVACGGIARRSGRFVKLAAAGCSGSFKPTYIHCSRSGRSSYRAPKVWQRWMRAANRPCPVLLLESCHRSRPHRWLCLVQPWTVGRYATLDQVDAWKRTQLVPDIALTRKNHQLYLPVIFPGFFLA